MSPGITFYLAKICCSIALITFQNASEKNSQNRFLVVVTEVTIAPSFAVGLTSAVCMSYGKRLICEVIFIISAII